MKKQIFLLFFALQTSSLVQISAQEGFFGDFRAKAMNFLKPNPELTDAAFSGDKDKIVPAFISAGYVKASNSNCVHQEIFPDTDHLKGWDKVWKNALSHPITCHSD